MSNNSLQHALLSAETGDRPRRIGCLRCKVALPLRLSREGEIAALWECASCRTRIAGVFVPELGPEMAHRVRLGEIHFATHPSAPIPEVLGELAGRWTRDHDRAIASERRHDDRFTTQLEAVVVCLDDNWIPKGQPAEVLVVDLSCSGLGMIARSMIKATRVAIQMESPAGTVQLLADITWSDHVGGGFHHIGARFIHRLAHRS